MAANTLHNWSQAMGLNHCRLQTGSRTPLAIDSAYVHRTSGDSVAVAITMPSLSPIAALYVFADDIANPATTQLTAFIYNEDATDRTRPGTTLRDTSDVCEQLSGLPGSADKWIKFTFSTPYTPAAIGEVLWVVVTNSGAAPTTDFPSILTTTDLGAGTTPISSRMVRFYTSTAGFSAAGTLVPSAPCVVELADGSPHGNHFTRGNTTPFANDTVSRGIAITTGSVRMSGVGVGYSTANFTAINGLSIYRSTDAANGAAWFTSAFGSISGQSSDELICYKGFTAQVLRPNTTYYVLFDFGANNQGPLCFECEDYATYSSVFDKFYDGQALCYAVQKNGAGWTLNKALCPTMGVALSAIQGLLANPIGGLIRV